MRTGARVRGWVQDARLDWVTAALLLVFVVLRLVATLGQPIGIFTDSSSYFVFKLWGGLRFPVVTASYSVIGDHRLIVSLQAVFGAACWSAAALIAGSLLDPRGLRYAFQGAVLALGLTLPVTRFDNTLLSESISLSLTVVLTALVLRFACRPTAHTGIAVFVIGALWAMTRQNNATTLGLAALVVAIAVVGGSPEGRRVAWRVAGGFFVVAVLGVALGMSTSAVVRYNTSQIYVRRVLSEPDRRPWFAARGMPPNGVELITAPFPPAPGSVDPAFELTQDATFGRWMRRHGPELYLRYLFTHLGYLVVMPFTHEGALPAVATGVTAYGSSDRVLPGVVETVFWPRDREHQTPVVLLVVGVVIVAAALSVRSSARRRSFVGGVGVLVVAAGNVIVVTHSAGWEYDRLLISTSMAVRLAILWLAATSVGTVDVHRERLPS